jgi:hypothetical protein
MKLSYRARVCLLVLNLLAVGLVTHPAKAQQFMGASLRIGTFNTAFVPWVPISSAGDRPNMAGCGDDWAGAPDINCRVGKIAGAILQSNYDVIVLNEVFDEDARHLFTLFLKGHYPNYVSRLEDSGTDMGTYVVAPDQDSGLMLFSKYPFLPPAGDLEECGVSDYDIDAGFENWPGYMKSLLVGFRGFGNKSHSEDRMASKGVGYVRIFKDDLVFNVFFTHLQASYGKVDNCHGAVCESASYNIRGIRSEQLQIIDDYASCVCPQWTHSGEVFILAGDLNINGDLSNPWHTGHLGNYNGHNRFDWDRYFGPGATEPSVITLGGNAYTRPLDTWAFSMTKGCVPEHGGSIVPGCEAVGPESLFKGTTTFDRGATMGSEERLDYILVGSPLWNTGFPSAPPNLMCAQHVTIAHNLNTPPNDDPTPFEGGLTGAQGWSLQTSDHMGLNAELEVSGPYCNPANALVDPPEEGPMVMTAPTSVHWIKMTKPGTYTFHVNPKNRVGNDHGPDNGLVYKVYVPSDMSKPIGSNYGEAIQRRDGEWDYDEMKYHVTEAPFYVKVFSPEPMTAPKLYYFVHERNDCTSEAEACEMYPYERGEVGNEERYPWPASAGFHQWFVVHADASDGQPLTGTSAAQTIRFFAMETVGTKSNIVKIELLDPSTSPPTVYASDTTETIVHHNGFPQRAFEIGPRIDAPFGLKDKWFFRVTRSTVQPVQDFDFWAGWTTNLKFVRGDRVVCDEAQEGGFLRGHDEIWMALSADSHGLPAWPEYMPPFGIEEGFKVGNHFKDDVDGWWGDQLLAAGGTNVRGESLRDEGAAKFVDNLHIVLGENDSNFDEMFTHYSVDTGPNGKGTRLKELHMHPGGGEYRVFYKVSNYLSDKSCRTDAPCEPPGKCESYRCN